MHLLYVDGSGDPGGWGATPGHHPSKRYILSAISVPAHEWNNAFSKFLQLRKHLKNTFGFPIRGEIKGRWLVYPKYADHPNRYKAIGPRKRRFEMYAMVLSNLAHVFTGSKVFNVHADKLNRGGRPAHTNFEEVAWNRLAQRFHNHLMWSASNAPGMIIADENNEPKVRSLLRKMRAHNPISSVITGTSYQAPITNLIEDPVFRVSQHSYFVQVADLISFALLLMLDRKYRNFNADRLFSYVEPLLEKRASRTDPHQMGIVHI